MKMKTYRCFMTAIDTSGEWHSGKPDAITVTACGFGAAKRGGADLEEAVPEEEIPEALRQYLRNNYRPHSRPHLIIDSPSASHHSQS